MDCGLSRQWYPSFGDLCCRFAKGVCSDQGNSDASLQQRSRRRSGEPAEMYQALHVWLRRLWSLTPTCSEHGLTAEHERCGRSNFWVTIISKSERKAHGMSRFRPISFRDLQPGRATVGEPSRVFPGELFAALLNQSQPAFPPNCRRGQPGPTTRTQTAFHRGCRKKHHVSRG